MTRHFLHSSSTPDRCRVVDGEDATKYCHFLLLYSVDIRMLLGLEKKDVILAKNQRVFEAYHEAEHTVVALKVGESDVVKRVSIVPRVTMFELEDVLHKDNQVAILLGGWACRRGNCVWCFGSDDGRDERLGEGLRRGAGDW